MSATDSLRDLFADEPPERFWRSVEARAGSPGFRVQLEREFPEIARLARAAPDRRTALKLMGASLLMAGVSACKAPDGIAPYVLEPLEVVPGRPRWFATSLSYDGYAVGVLGETHEGRPTKLEGNPQHPASLGSTDAATQAAPWSLYDPTRSRVPLHGNEPVTWGEAQAALSRVRETYQAKNGAGLALLVGNETSPTLQRLVAALRAQYRSLRLYRHAPLQPAGGQRTIYDFEKAVTILSLGADFLGEGPGKLAYARALMGGRRVRTGRAQMNRLVVIESAMTITGATADVRRPVRPHEIDGVAGQLLAAIEDGAEVEPWIAEIVRSLQSGTGVVVPADNGSEYLQQAAARLNRLLDAPATVVPIETLGEDGDLEALVADIDSGTVETLFCLDVDVVYSAPPRLGIVERLSRLSEMWHYGLHTDETARQSDWHIAATHDLESWGDLRAFDGTASLQQPLIAPLYEGRTKAELLAALLGDYTSGPRELVRATWDKLSDDAWHEALRVGIVADSRPGAGPLDEVPRPTLPTTARENLSLLIRPDPFLRDGSLAANLPLLELPRPLTKLVWGNAAELSPATAERLDLHNGDEVLLRRGAAGITLPVFVLPGTADDTVVVPTGWGRTTGEDAPVGTNSLILAGSDEPLVLAKTGRTLDLITTQEHHATEGRDIVHELALDDFPAATAEAEQRASLMPDWPEPEEAWGMSIDTGACIGCMACVSACNAENNIPVVGAEEVARGHDMHWLRVDRYFSGDVANPDAVFQPVPCMQCEEAPCEVVCPVNASVHTHDGLNAQVYNRCIGTRYCSQNCPYKVRRFNFFDYQQDVTENSPLSLLMNPDVTVRERGVMEKCTYCVQRIAEARIDGRNSDEPIADGAVVTACQQACPTQAIVFGNIKDRSSRVAAEKAEPHSYAMLAELGTKPRTTYLAKVRNRD